MQTFDAYHHEAWIGLNNVAMKSLEYCLPATTLTKSECDKEMWQLLKTFLPKVGVNRFIQRDVLYVPHSV